MWLRQNTNIAILVFGGLLAWGLSTGLALAQEDIQVPIGMSAEVVKAEFNETMWAVTTKGNDVYEISIRVPNTGTYEGTAVEVVLSSVVHWRYLQSDATPTYEVRVEEENASPVVRWIFPSIPIGEAAEITAQFYSKNSVDELAIHIQVNSLTAAPIGVSTLGPEDADETKDAELETPSSQSKMRVWWDGVREKGAKLLRDVSRALNQWLEDFLDWLRSVT